MGIIKLTEKELTDVIIKVYDKQNVKEPNLGVPDGLLDSSDKLYNGILNTLKKNSDDEILMSDFNFPITDNFNIGKINFSSIRVYVYVIYGKKIEKIGNGGMEYEPEIDNFEITNLAINYSNDKINNSSIIVKFSCPYNIILKKGDLANFMVENKIEITKNITHELKHKYDTYIRSNNKNTMVKNSNYKSIGNRLEEDEIPLPLSYFLYGIYYTDDKENLTRNSEMYSLLKQNNIKRNNFKSFIENTEIYSTLKDLSEMNFDYTIYLLKENYIPQIKIQLAVLNPYLDSKILTNNNPNEIINEYLKMIYLFILRDKKKSMIGYISKIDQELVGEINKNAPLLVKHLSDTTTNYLSYYYEKQKEINRKSLKTLDSIYKLYGKLTESETTKIINEIIQIFESFDHGVDHSKFKLTKLSPPKDWFMS